MLAQEDVNSTYPDEWSWRTRKEKFRRLEGVALGDYPQRSHPQKEALIRELEHVFCAGAWVATVILAWAIADMHLTFMGYDKKGQKRREFLFQYMPFEPVEDLRLARNSLCHRAPDQEASIRARELIRGRDKLREEAVKAVSTSLNVAFIDTKFRELSAEADLA